MKKFFLSLVLLSLCTASFTQITKHGEIIPSENEGLKGLLLLDVSGLKYAFYKLDISYSGNDSLFLYNMDYSVFKKIKIARTSFQNKTPYYFSENLFDNDNDIEYIADDMDENFSPCVNIYNESGEIQQAFNNYYLPYNEVGVNGSKIGNSFINPPIFNVDNTARMILLYAPNDGTPFRYDIFNLFGMLVTDNNGIKLGEITPLYKIAAYPNPARESFQIDYELPLGVNEAKLELLNINGTSIKSYSIDNTFNKLLIDTSTLKSGIYIYRISSGGKLIGTGKVVIEK